MSLGGKAGREARAEGRKELCCSVTVFTTGSSEETFVAATGLVGQVLSAVHMCMHLIPYLFKGCIQVGLPVLLIQAVYEFSQLDLGEKMQSQYFNYYQHKH